MDAAPGRRKVYIVDDHPIVRHGLRELIEQEGDLAVCGEAEDGPEALNALNQLRPDIILLDISLKTTSGIDLVGPIHEKAEGVPVLILSMHDEVRFAERSLKAGAQGYIMKQDPPENLILAIRRVLEGDIYLSEGMTSRMLKKVASGTSQQELSPADILSSRELEIFTLIGQGKGTREVAEMLDLSVKTVDAHRANIKKKLDLKSATELVQRAITWTLSRDGV